MSTPALSQSDIAAAMRNLPGWQLDGDRIKKLYQFDTYLAGLAFANAVGVLSEAHDHHPEIHIGWRKVTVIYSTHDAGNKITQRDINVAIAIEQLGYPKTK